jgi:hypothetical protein
MEGLLGIGGGNINSSVAGSIDASAVVNDSFTTPAPTAEQSDNSRPKDLPRLELRIRKWYFLMAQDFSSKGICARDELVEESGSPLDKK